MPDRLVNAWPRRMSMPKYDSTPQMFENRNGLSSETTVSSHASAFFSRKKCASFGRMSRESRT